MLTNSQFKFNEPVVSPKLEEGLVGSSAQVPVFLEENLKHEQLERHSNSSIKLNTNFSLMNKNAGEDSVKNGKWSEE